MYSETERVACFFWFIYKQKIMSFLSLFKLLVFQKKFPTLIRSELRALIGWINDEKVSI